MTLFLKMADFGPLRGRGKGGRVPILSHPYKGILSHFSDNVTGGRDAIITVWLINIHYWQFYNICSDTSNYLEFDE